MELVFLGKIFIVFIALGIVFIIIERLDRKNYLKRMREVFGQEWGYDTREEYSEKIFQNIRYYSEKKKTECDIDDITWNDLEMDTIFMRLNHTRTSVGEEYLYHVLRSPKYTAIELEEREKTIQSLSEHPALRSDLEIGLFQIGKTDKISVYEYLTQTCKLKKIAIWHHVLAALVLLSCIACLLVSPAGAIAALFVFMVANAYFYYKEKANIGIENVALLQFVLSMIKQGNEIAKIQIPGCEKYFGRLEILGKKFNKFCRFHFLVSGGNSVSGNLFDSIFDYIRILFHVDLIKLATMIREIQKNENDLLEIYEIIGYLDSMLAIASYRYGVKQYVVPELYLTRTESDARRIMTENLYHPLLQNPVKNDLSTDKCVLLTGSNASGKSTFIKAVAINAIFAQTIHTVLADMYKAPYYRIYSSMALRDDILSNESYFIVEIKSLKRIFAKLEISDIPVLCFVDEILRGTNTVERVAASTQLLKELTKEKAMCFAATHDIELTYLLEEVFANYHFEEVMGENDISFDYKLKSGRANSRNAIRLLEMIGFSKEIVTQAQNRVEHFLSEGKWK